MKAIPSTKKLQYTICNFVLFCCTCYDHFATSDTASWRKHTNGWLLAMASLDTDLETSSDETETRTSRDRDRLL